MPAVVENPIVRESSPSMGEHAAATDNQNTLVVNPDSASFNVGKIFRDGEVHSLVQARVEGYLYNPLTDTGVYTPPLRQALVWPSNVQAETTHQIPVMQDSGEVPNIGIRLLPSVGDQANLEQIARDKLNPLSGQPLPTILPYPTNLIYAVPRPLGIEEQGIRQGKLIPAKDAFLGRASETLASAETVSPDIAPNVLPRVPKETIAKAALQLSCEIPGLSQAQAHHILERAFHKSQGATSVVFFGSRVRGDHRPSSDLDVGFNGLTGNQAKKVIAEVRHAAARNDFGNSALRLEETSIVPGRIDPKNRYKPIISPEEFAMRSGTRSFSDADKAGEPFKPSGYIKVDRDGKITIVKPSQSI